MTWRNVVIFAINHRRWLVLSWSGHASLVLQRRAVHTETILHSTLSSGVVSITSSLRRHAISPLLKLDKGSVENLFWELKSDKLVLILSAGEDTDIADDHCFTSGDLDKLLFARHLTATQR